MDFLQNGLQKNYFPYFSSYLCVKIYGLNCRIVVNNRLSYFQILDPFESPYETGNLDQVGGATNRGVLQSKMCYCSGLYGKSTHSAVTPRGY